MRILLALLVGLLATPIASPAWAQLHPTARTVVTQAIEMVIRPAFAAYAEETAALKGRIDTLCVTPSADALDQAHYKFSAVVIAWGRVELYQLGPLLADNRSDRILFWPDRKGIALRQVQAILAGPDWDAFDPETLRSKSVAVQGLGALEYLLYGTDSERLATIEADFRCNYALAIATLLSETAQEMSAEWNDPEGISKRLMFPAKTDVDYRTTAEVQQALVGLLAHGVEAIRDQRILPFLGRDGEKPKPKSGLFWRSDMTVNSIAANFEGLEDLLMGSDIWEYAPTEQFSIGAEAKGQFAQAAASAAAVTKPLEAALADPGEKALFDEMVVASQKLGKLLGEELPAALGLSVGFSSLDGD